MKVCYLRGRRHPETGTPFLKRTKYHEEADFEEGWRHGMRTGIGKRDVGGDGLGDSDYRYDHDHKDIAASSIMNYSITRNGLCLLTYPIV